MRSRISQIVLLCTCCLLIQSRPAIAARQHLAVLGIEPRDTGDARSQQRSAALARALTDSLRARAMVGGSFDLAPSSQKELMELKLLSDCIDEAPECMAAIGRDLGADVVLYGHLERKKDGSYAVSIRSIVVATKRPGDLTFDRTVAAAEASDEGLRKLAPLILASEAANPPPTAHDTALIVDTNVTEGTILVNGIPRGAITTKNPTVIRGLPPGTVTLAITSPRFQGAEMSVEIREREAARASLRLEPIAPASPPLPASAAPAPSSSGGQGRVAREGGTARVLFWTSLVATGAGVAAFTITGLQVRSIEREQDDAIAGFDFSANGGVTHPGDACAEAKADGYAKLTDICDRGHRMATVTNVLIGATAVAAVATAIFYWRGYLASGNNRERADAHKKPGDTGLVFSPEIYKSGAGFGASVTF